MILSKAHRSDAAVSVPNDSNLGRIFSIRSLAPSFECAVGECFPPWRRPPLDPPRVDDLPSLLPLGPALVFRLVVAESRSSASIERVFIRSDLFAALTSTSSASERIVFAIAIVDQRVRFGCFSIFELSIIGVQIPDGETERCRRDERIDSSLTDRSRGWQRKSIARIRRTVDSCASPVRSQHRIRMVEAPVDPEGPDPCHPVPARCSATGW